MSREIFVFVKPVSVCLVAKMAVFLESALRVAMFLISQVFFVRNRCDVSCDEAVKIVEQFFQENGLY